ncbi:MAG TPA: class E sortase, partial [Gaiellaceae bacterium]
MRLRILSRALIGAGVLLLAWVLLVWQWQDPFTALYTTWKQHELAGSLDKEFSAFQPAAGMRKLALAAQRDAVASEAAQFRRQTHQGQAIGRIIIGRIGLNMVVVDGTGESALKKGPGRDLRSYMPGQNRLVYIAGHRTTYLAPFSNINDIRVGDYIRLEMPYATFVYR